MGDPISSYFLTFLLSACIDTTEQVLVATSQGGLYFYKDIDLAALESGTIFLIQLIYGVGHGGSSQPLDN